MKVAFASCMALIILIVSCKKSNDQINTPPVGRDTVTMLDTSTLIKSNLEYFYDAGGTIIVDSELTQWIYDDQRRVIQQINAYNDYLDTFRFTYLNDRTVETGIYYKDGSRTSIANIVKYLGLENRIDSILGTDSGYGILAGYLENAATYFYYNQENRVSLEKHFGASPGVPSLTYFVNYFYTGANLDSATTTNVFQDQGGTTNHIEYVDYYSGGNPISKSYFTNDVLTQVDNYTYTNIPYGEFYIFTLIPNQGFYFPYKATKLISGTAIFYVPTSTTFTDTYTYQLDSANRVSVMLIDRHGSIEKQVFTYY